MASSRGDATSKDAGDIARETYRDTIRTLYLDNNYSLEQVTHTVNERYKINASKAQVEARCKRWNYDKNLTKDKWTVVGREVLKRKADGKASEVCLQGLPLNDKRIRKAISRYGLARDETVPLAPPSPPLPDGVTIRTPVLATMALTSICRTAGTTPPRHDVTFNSSVSISDSYPTMPSIYESALVASLPFALFRITTDTDVQFCVNHPKNVNLAPIVSVNDFRASVMQHFESQFSLKEPQSSFNDCMHALLPTSLISGQSDALKSLSGCHMSPAPVLFGLAVFMLSNNFWCSTSDIGKKFYEFTISHGGEGLLEHILSGNDPTTEAIVEHLFAFALENKDARTVRRILMSGFSLDELGSGSWYEPCPLHVACRMRSLDLVRVLVEAGADVNKVNHRGRSPLMSAVDVRDLDEPSEDLADMELVNLLLHNGADVNLCDGIESPLMAAAAVCHTELVEVLLTKGAYPDFSGPRDRTYQTPLHQAITSEAPSRRIMSTVESLIRHGANVNARAADDDDESISVLTAAARWQADLVPLLLDNGAVLSESELPEVVGSRGTDIARLLLASGVKVTIQSIAYAVQAYGTTGEKLKRFNLLLKFADAKIRHDCRHQALLSAIEGGHCDLVALFSEIKPRATSPLHEAIRIAVRRGYIHTLRVLLRKESRYRCEVIKALHGSLADVIAAGDDELVALLLQTGADVSQASSFSNKTPLLEALTQCDVGLCWKLLAAGASVNTNQRPLDSNLSKYGSTATVSTTTILPAAVELGDRNLIRHIVELGAEVNAPLAENNSLTALTVAVRSGDAALVQFLIDNGADVNAPAAERTGQTALVAAIRRNDTKMVRYLMEMGASVNESALLAAVPKSFQLIQYLLTIRLARCPRYPYGFGSQALRYAVVSSNHTVVRTLLQNGISPNTFGRARFGPIDQNVLWDATDQVPLWKITDQVESPFGTALRFEQNLDIIRTFLGCGAKVNSVLCEPEEKHDSHCIPLVVATEQRRLDLVKLLIEAGADVNAIISHPPKLRITRTPLQAAVEKGCMDIVKLLLDNGADVNAPPWKQRGATALQFAAIQGYIGIAVLLLEHGAEVDAAPAEEHGRTALEGASEHGRLDMVQLLLTAGAKTVGSGSKQYERAQQFAAKHRHGAVKRLLQRAHAEQLEQFSAQGSSAHV